MLKFCLLLRCLSSFYKKFHKIRRGFVCSLLSTFGTRKTNKVLHFFGCSIINHFSDRQPYNFAAHHNRNNTTIQIKFITTHAVSLVIKYQLNDQSVKEIANMSNSEVVVMVRQQMCKIFYNFYINFTSGTNFCCCCKNIPKKCMLNV